MVSKALPQARAMYRKKFKKIIELHLYYKTVEIYFLKHTY
jgi:hypothetical protein